KGYQGYLQQQDQLVSEDQDQIVTGDDYRLESDFGMWCDNVLRYLDRAEMAKARALMKEDYVGALNELERGLEWALQNSRSIRGPLSRRMLDRGLSVAKMLKTTSGTQASVKLSVHFLERYYGLLRRTIDELDRPHYRHRGCGYCDLAKV